MSTALVLANKNLLVNIDYALQLKDLYFPHIGQENQLNRYVNKMFLYFDGQFHEVNDQEWQVNIDYVNNSLIGSSSITHKTAQIKVEFEDYIASDKNIYFRDFKVINSGSKAKEVMIYFQNNFALAESNFADTVVWYQPAGCLMQYKKNRFIGCGTNNKFYQFTCAAKSDNNGSGAYPGKDGLLAFNPVSTGNVNSCVSFKFKLNANSSIKSNIYYICARDIDEINTLTKYLKQNSVEVIKNKVILSCNELLEPLNTRIGLNKLSQLLSPERAKKIIDLYRQSQLLIRTQIDASGSVIAANDGQYLKKDGTDTYSYYWPRDGANVIQSLISSGFQAETERYFHYAFRLMESKGYFLHKYFPSAEGKIKYLGSSWHPWIDSLGNTQLPIQEDATALNLYAFGCYLEKFSSYQLLARYWPKVQNMIKFLMEYTFKNYASGPNINKFVEGFEFNKKDPFASLKGSFLPLPSYDIWEQYYGVFTYTAVTVYAALQKAVTILDIKGEQKLMEKVLNFLPKLKLDIDHYLLDENKKVYFKGIRTDPRSDELIYDHSADASLFVLSQYGYLTTDDPILGNTTSDLVQRLTVTTPISGLARKENDHYLRLDQSYTGNPWFIPVFWKAQYEIRKNELNEAANTLDWAIMHADRTGLMAEQVDPYTGYGLSVKPLTWNHAEFVQTINLLLARI